MSRPTHLIPTADEFAVIAQRLVDEIGGGLPLHPANRLTACGKRMTDLLERGGRCSTAEAEVTCKTCRNRVRRNQHERSGAT